MAFHNSMEKKMRKDIWMFVDKEGKEYTFETLNEAVLYKRTHEGEFSQIGLKYNK